jgi:PTH1 family peptidyl-tRNA hydrolase
MKLIVGLGNPGRQYDNTRHNVGFRVIDLLAQQARIFNFKNGFNAEYAKTILAGEAAVLAKPMTYMNRSGDAVMPLLQWFKLTPEDLIVLCDDIHLPLGQLRLRGQGSDGGHNGLKSIIRQTGSNRFTRIRLGINEPPPVMDQADYVLGHFSRGELPEVEKMVCKAADAVECILARGIETAMNQFNVRKNKNTGDENE